MPSLTVRLPEKLIADIKAESARRGCSKSEIVRERLERAVESTGDEADPLHAIADLIGSVDDDLPPDLSARTKHYLSHTGYGRERDR
jgi:Arc/MetJ-type ribon-helix-helix transcriptional regulator